jgi:hypothetical protein
MMRRIEIRRVWKFSGRHRVLPLTPEWLGGAEYVVVQRLNDGSLLITPALGVKTDGEAARLESELNGEVRGRDG